MKQIFLFLALVLFGVACKQEKAGFVDWTKATVLLKKKMKGRAIAACWLFWTNICRGRWQYRSKRQGVMTLPKTFSPVLCGA